MALVAMHMVYLVLIFAELFAMQVNKVLYEARFAGERTSGYRKKTDLQFPTVLRVEQAATARAPNFCTMLNELLF